MSGSIDTGIRTELGLSHLRVTPGQPAPIQIEVTNTSDVIDGVTAIIDGVNPDWVLVDQPMMSLFPATSGQLELVFDIPTECAAGDYLVMVRIVSTLDGERQSAHDFWLTVDAVPGLDLTMRPRIVSGRKQATATAVVVNTGNAPAEVTLDAVEPSRDVDCLVETSAILIPQGHEALVDITMRGPRPWFGVPDARTITVTASTPELGVEEILTFNQKPRIPRGLVTMLILAGIIGLWAFIFFWAIREMRAEEPIMKRLSPTILEGEENIPLAEIAGTAEGRVTAAPAVKAKGIRAAQTAGALSAENADGLGVAKITVEALRVLPDRSRESVASVATEEDGTFRLETLLPGTYTFRFSGDGYPTMWLGEVHKPKKAETLLLDPKDVIGDIGIGLAGKPGTITGTVALPPGTGSSPGGASGTGGTDATGDTDPAGGTDGAGGDDGTGVEAIATLAPQAGQSEFSTDPVPVLPDGTYTIEDLPTPATYTVTIRGENFRTQQFETTLAGGETPQLNPVYLPPGPGTITGSVIDEGGRPLGAVEVVARGGDLEFSTTTPTSGAVGTYTLTDLPTPETYVLTITKEGYSGETVALALDAGEAAAVGTTRLVQGIGSITGRAVTQGPFGLQAAGNVPVVLYGDGVFAETSTLSQDGTFTISGLPVPGSYSVTVGGTDYQAETTIVRFDAAAPETFSAPRALGDILLLRSTSSVGGYVRVGSAGIGELTVTMTDGLVIRTTRTATDPAGRYEFTGVPEGSYTLAVTIGEEEPITLRVAGTDVEAGIDTALDIVLPSPPEVG